ncbi:hypothetical protein HaLaN_19910 [Haematococcus lacustris]|uniref:Uncharacterized protein n=1 Tax=Haematococcus lacustris TaxID=44745 RepID=A0A699ZJF8_HAELA|nr:hypothetical protein HaLaN_19910 [Haematococcus lacustris]
MEGAFGAKGGNALVSLEDARAAWTPWAWHGAAAPDSKPPPGTGPGSSGSIGSGPKLDLDACLYRSWRYRLGVAEGQTEIPFGELKGWAASS